MKRILICLFVILLFVSCSNNEGANAHTEIEVEGTYDVRNLSPGQSINLIVDSNDVVNFPECSVENIYSVSGKNTDRGMRGDSETPSDNLVETSLGDKLVTPHTNPDDNTASGKDLGASDKKITVKVTRNKTDYDMVIAPEEIEEIAAFSGAKRDSRGWYRSLPIKEYYHIPMTRLSGLGDLKEVAIFQQLVDLGGVCYDYGFIRENRISLVSNDNDIYGVVDLSGKEGEISLFNAILADVNEGELRLLIEKPVVLTSDSQDMLEANSFSGKAFVYKIEKNTDGKKYVVEITKPQGIASNNYEILNGWGLGDARYINTEVSSNNAHRNGRRRRLMLTPIKNTEEKLVLYVGEIEETFIFNMAMKKEYENYGTIRLREMTEDDSSSLAVLSTENGVGNDNKVTLTLTSETGVIGFVIQNKTNKDYTIDGKYEVEGSEKPALRLDKRGTDLYYCNGNIVSQFSGDFNSNTLMGFPHEGIQGNSTIIYYMTYAKSSSVPVKITLSFGEEFFR